VSACWSRATIAVARAFGAVAAVAVSATTTAIEWASSTWAGWPAAHLIGMRRVWIETLSDEFFDGSELRRVAVRYERQCLARATGTARSTYAVDVVLGTHRHVEVNDVCDVWDVYSASGDIGCDKHIDATSTKLAQDALALAL
jgi:hypothetical protein